MTYCYYIQFGEDSQKGPINMTALRILTCSSQKCYIILYGRTRFGLVLTDWLIEHGATKIFLVSTSSKALRQIHMLFFNRQVIKFNVNFSIFTEVVLESMRECEFGNYAKCYICSVKYVIF